MKRQTLHTILLILIGVCFFVPLVVVTASFIFPFIVPKILAFRSLVLLILATFLALLASDWERYKFRLTPVNIAVGVYLLSFTISTFVAFDWYKSFWDSHERMLGLFTMVHYMLFYFIAASAIRGWETWRTLLRWFLFAGSLVMIVALYQKYIDPQALLNAGKDRVSSTLGNPIYLSGYGLFLALVGFMLAVKEKAKSGWQIYAIVCGLLGFFAIFLGGTRGAFLGFVAAIGTLTLSYLLFLKKKKRARQILLGILIGLLLFVGVSYANRDTAFVKNIPAIGRLVNISLTSGTAQTRLMAWGIAVDGWKDHPVFGWGPNNYYYAFNEYYRPAFLRHGWGETWFDNAHNIVMNTLTTQGVVGLLAYLSMFGGGLYVLYGAYRREQIDVHILSGSAAILISHFVATVFVFENPTSLLYFFFFLAFVSSISAKPIVEKEGARAPRPVPGAMMGVVTFVILLFVYVTNINPARANTTALHVIRVFAADPLKGIEQYQEAVMIPTPHVDDIRADFGRTVMQRISAAFSNLQALNEAQKSELTTMFTVAFEGLEKNKVLHPEDIRIHIQQTQMLQMIAQINQDAAKLIEAEKIIDEAHGISPDRQQILYLQAAIKMQVGKPTEAIQILEATLEQDTKITESWWRLALGYAETGQLDKFESILERAETEGIVFAPEFEQIFAEIKNAATATPSAQ